MATEMDEEGNWNLGQFNIASVDRLRFPLSKDGVAWTGIDSVTLEFEAPDRSTTFSRSATLETPDAGVWYYDTVVTDFDSATDDVGFWKISVTVVDGSITKTYPYEIGFTVVDQA